MLTPGVFIGLAIFWVLTCGLVLWLIWRAARTDAPAPPAAEQSKAASPAENRTDRAA